MADYLNALAMDPQTGLTPSAMQGQQPVFRFVNDLSAWGNSLNQTLASPLIDPRTRALSPLAEQYAGMVGGFAGTALNTVPQNALTAGIRAYHGSPADFDAFSLDKIGTGEGAQAYGHGLYFAENEGTAQSYRDVLSGNVPSGPETQWLAKSGGDPQKALAMFNEWSETMGQPQTAAQQEVRSKLEAILNPRGRMYEVNLNAQPHELLDWDKPLSQQSPHVQEALGNAGLLKRWQTVDPSTVRGEHVYDSILARHGHEPGDAVQALREAGIKGIRYLDQGSRGAGEGTSNYVMFDPATIEILRKYGLAGLGIGLGGAATQGQ